MRSLRSGVQSSCQVRLRPMLRAQRWAPPVKSSNKSGRKSGLDGTVWVNTDLAFPKTTVLDKESMLPGDTNTRMVGTNSVTTTTGPKYIREHVTITLLKATPPVLPAE